MATRGFMAALPNVMAGTLLLCVVVASLSPSTAAQDCTGFTFSGNRQFALCKSLLRLRATLHWTYHPSNGTVDTAFRAPQSSNGWVAWGINPRGPQMLGTQALVALVNSSTNAVNTYTSQVTGAPLEPANISIPVSNLQAEYSSGAFTIYAILQLANNRTEVSHVWQSSTIKSGAGFPSAHPTFGDNVRSTGSLDFLSG